MIKIFLRLQTIFTELEQGRNQDFAKVGGLKMKIFLTLFWWRILGDVIWWRHNWYTWSFITS